MVPKNNSCKPGAQRGEKKVSLRAIGIPIGDLKISNISSVFISEDVSYEGFRVYIILLSGAQLVSPVRGREACVSMKDQINKLLEGSHV